MLQTARPGRLNDLWALALYSAAYGGSLTLSLAIILKSERIFSPRVLYRLLNIVPMTLSLVSILSSFGLLLSLLFYAISEKYPKTVIYGGFAAFILFILASNLSVFLISPVAALFSGLASTALMAIESVLFYRSVRKNIDPIAAMTSIVSSIFKKYFLRLAILLFNFLLLTAVLMVPILGISLSGSRYMGVGIAFALIVYMWTFCIFNYMSMVLASSVVVGEINDYERRGNSFGKAVRRTLLALGSICAGGLVAASAYTFNRHTMPESADRRPRFSSLILDLVEDLFPLVNSAVKLVNVMAFSYLVVHGTGYSASLKGSGMEFAKLNGTAALGVVTGISHVVTLVEFAIFFAFLSASAIYVYFIEQTLHMAVSAAVAVSISLIIVCLLLNVFSSGAMALLYVHSIDPDALQTYNEASKLLFDPEMPLDSK